MSIPPKKKISIRLQVLLAFMLVGLVPVIIMFVTIQEGKSNLMAAGVSFRVI